ncbi:50S ribosomal protein L32 [Kamptonema cortianum]|nr:50S ribosomal protein L32 [Oscillatoria laete-virens]MDK3157122.1 50S ribosomal protein L32 [Kamptonema cortianum]MDL5051098.1 50S ribosomal protein L32 [Oscillatoria amoena NRMC-F 0135]MDL5055006.1 50S ribosomal protein L32 [Oscillatoria laete-virens NRMC-F 0139]
MGVPKRKTSLSRLRSRRAAKRWKAGALALDKESGTRHIPHRVNPATGMYKGRQIITVEAGK